jgi:hypothetical protein
MPTEASIMIIILEVALIIEFIRKFRKEGSDA